MARNYFDAIQQVGHGRIQNNAEYQQYITATTIAQSEAITRAYDYATLREAMRNLQEEYANEALDEITRTMTREGEINMSNSFDIGSRPTTTPPPVPANYTDFELRKRNGTVRKISAPNDELKRIQREKLPLLYNTFANLLATTTLVNTYFGFLPRTNVVMAAKQHIGYASTASIDISNFFDSVTKDMLRDKMSETDLRMISQCFHREGYCAQGFPTSPILANIASIPFMVNIQMYLKRMFGNNFALTIYADDIHISTPLSDKKQIKTEVIEPIIKILNNFKFEANTNKTSIRLAINGYRRILGVNVGHDHIRTTRKIMKKIRAARHQGNIQSLGGLSKWATCPEPSLA